MSQKRQNLSDTEHAILLAQIKLIQADAADQAEMESAVKNLFQQYREMEHQLDNLSLAYNQLRNRIRRRLPRRMTTQLN